MQQKAQPQIVSAAEVSRNFGLWQDRTSHSPLIVTHHGRPRVAMVNIETYEALSTGNVSEAAPVNDKEEMRLSVLAEHINGCFCAFDRELRFTRLNSEALVHFEKPASALIGRSMGDLYPKNYEGPVIAALRRAADGGDEAFIDVPSQLRPDRLLRMRIFSYPGGCAVIFRNVAHEVQIEHDAHERQALYAARDAHGGIVVARLSLRATFDRPEPSLARITGYPADQLRGIRLTDLLAVKDRSRVTSEIEAVLGHGESRRLRSQLLVSGAERVEACIALAAIREGFGITGAMMMMTVERNS